LPAIVEEDNGKILYAEGAGWIVSEDKILHRAYIDGAYRITIEAAALGKNAANGKILGMENGVPEWVMPQIASGTPLVGQVPRWSESGPVWDWVRAH